MLYCIVCWLDSNGFIASRRKVKSNFTEAVNVYDMEFINTSSGDRLWGEVRTTPDDRSRIAELKRNTSVIEQNEVGIQLNRNFSLSY